MPDVISMAVKAPTLQIFLTAEHRLEVRIDGGFFLSKEHKSPMDGVSQRHHLKPSKSTALIYLATLACIHRGFLATAECKASLPKEVSRWLRRASDRHTKLGSLVTARGKSGRRTKADGPQKRKKEVGRLFPLGRCCTEINSPS